MRINRVPPVHQCLTEKVPRPGSLLRRLTRSLLAENTAPPRKGPGKANVSRRSLDAVKLSYNEALDWLGDQDSNLDWQSWESAEMSVHRSRFLPCSGVVDRPLRSSRE